LEPGRTLGYYILHNQDTLEYRRKTRTLRVRMLDGAVKTILVDDSQPVSQLMVVIWYENIKLIELMGRIELQYSLEVGLIEGL